MKLLKFYAEWCGPCKTQTEVLKGFDLNGTELEEIDIDVSIDQAVKYKVRSVPTLVLLNDAGEEVGRKIGLQNAQQLKAFLA